MAAKQFPSRMNATDEVFWTMDAIPEFRSTIGCVILLERAPDRERVRAEFERLSRSFVRMRQRVVEVPLHLAPPEWVEDDQYDIDYHVRSLAVPAPGSLEELLAEVSPLFATPLDRSRPLWETYLAEGLAGGKGALFVKMHHCLTDGVGGARLAEAVMATSSAAEPDRPPAPQRPRRTDTVALLVRAQLHNLAEATSTSLALGRALVDALLDPQGTASGLLRGARMAAGFASELTATRARSPLHHRRSLSRRLATFAIPLDEIDFIRRRLEATNNDVVLTLVSGAMHRWHTSRGADVKELRALVPVNLRAERDTSAGNRIALLALRLPVGEPDPLERLRTIQERTGRVKSDRRAAIYPVLARAMTLLPLSVATALGRQQTRRANFVCTNVPGPRRPMYVAGERVEAIYPYAPLVGDHPVAIALLTYGDTMFVGLDVDPLAMPDLPHFLDALRESCDELMNLSRRAPESVLRPAVQAEHEARRAEAAPA